MGCDQPKTNVGSPKYPSRCGAALTGDRIFVTVEISTHTAAVEVTVGDCSYPPAAKGAFLAVARVGRIRAAGDCFLGLGSARELTCAAVPRGNPVD